MNAISTLALVLMSLIFPTVVLAEERLVVLHGEFVMYLYDRSPPPQVLTGFRIIRGDFVGHDFEIATPRDGAPASITWKQYPRKEGEVPGSLEDLPLLSVKEAHIDVEQWRTANRAKREGGWTFTFAATDGVWELLSVNRSITQE